MKTPARLSRLYVWRYLHVWDVASIARRDEIIDKFIEEYTTVDAIDTDYLFSRAGGLLFTRFTVGMQMAFARRKPVWSYFQALGVFVKSLQAERYIVEFTLMGALISTFEVLRVDEMKDKDKSYVFQFLIRMIEGCGGIRVKEFICSDTSYLESVVDCLTMCKNRTVIHHARVFLENMSQGNTMSNINMVSRYVISLLPCDFNPRVQALACRVLPIIIHQNPDIAGNCYSLVVDALKTDYNEMLVDIGELSLAMMETPFADDLLVALMESALPCNISDNLETRGVSDYNLADTSHFNPSGNDGNREILTSSTTLVSDANSKAAFIQRDTYFRLQYGAVYTLSFMLKNKPQLVDWLVEKGIVGSILATIGTAPYTEIQLAGVRLLLLVHELSPECNAAVAVLLPKKLLVILLSEGENSLQYLTAPMCVSLRRIGRSVQSNWTEYFTTAVFPTTTTRINIIDGKNSIPQVLDLSPTIQQIQQECEVLMDLTKDGLFTTSQTMPIIYLDETYRNQLMIKTSATSHSTTSVARFLPLSEVGEAQILADSELEGFRKYLPKAEGAGMEDDFEKFGIGHFQLDDDDDGGQEHEQGAMTDLEAAMLEDALKAMDEHSGQEEEEEEEDTEEKDGFNSFDLGAEEVANSENHGVPEKPN
ncbi:unnamed protein product [Allacma fusca]|uniref:Uncharacterized protein n=1 Tax=Allacma fusca TaxID=39272 RepID=A0A8J2Q7C1_9HEXA|nr:unnamed protein product [Allacma fusca]